MIWATSRARDSVLVHDDPWYELMFVGRGNRLGAGAYAKFPEEIGAVELNGCVAHAEPVANLVLGEPVRQQRKNLALAAG